MVELDDVKCNRCNERCQGDVINTYGKYYHQRCFSCFVSGCKQDLSFVGCFYIDGEIYCRSDYHELKGTKCLRCNQWVEGEAVFAVGLQFHPSCFSCVNCEKSFPVGANICYDGEELFCQHCSISPQKQTTEENSLVAVETGNKRIQYGCLNSENKDVGFYTCAACGERISREQGLIALNKQWHLWCFTCHVCGDVLTDEYIERDGLPYCEKDYRSEFCVCCAGCGDFITGQVMQAGEKCYHPSCSLCVRCGKAFAEGETMLLQGSQIWHPDCSGKMGQYLRGDVNSEGICQFENSTNTSDSKVEVNPKQGAKTIYDFAPNATSEMLPKSHYYKIPSSDDYKPGEPSVVSNDNGQPSLHSVQGFRPVKSPVFHYGKPPVPTATTATKTTENRNAAVVKSDGSQWRRNPATGIYTRHSLQTSTNVKTRPFSYCEKANKEDKADMPDKRFPSTGNINIQSSRSLPKIADAIALTARLKLNSSGNDIDGINAYFPKSIAYNKSRRKSSPQDSKSSKLSTTPDLPLKLSTSVNLPVKFSTNIASLIDLPESINFPVKVSTNIDLEIPIRDYTAELQTNIQMPDKLKMNSQMRSLLFPEEVYL